MSSQPRLGGSLRASLMTLLVGALMLGVFARFLTAAGPLWSLGAVAVAGAVIATLVRLEAGMVLLVVAMLFSPEIRLVGLPGRALTLRFEDLIVPVILLAWLSRAAAERGLRELRLHRLFWLLAGYLSVAAVSSLRAAGEGRVQPEMAALYMLKQVEFFGLCAFAILYIRSFRQLRLLLVLAIATAVALALYNYARLPTTEVWTSNRITAPFEGASPEPSTIGGYFAFSMALIIAMLLYAPRGPRKWLVAALAILLPPFLLTLSRTSYVAFLTLVALLAVWTRHRKLIGTLVAGLLLSPLLLPERVVSRILDTFNDRIKVFGIFDRSLGERIYIWWKVYFALPQKPLIGWGVTWQDVVDSSYARLLLETGLLGTLLYVGALVALARVGTRVARTAPSWWIRGFGVGYTVGLVGLMVHGLTAITFNIIRIMEPFWLISGAVIATDRLIAQAAADEAREPAPQPMDAAVDGADGPALQPAG